ncbi:AraC family transcriptional regulator [Chitinilyticum piscinae]|uniref:AraC family transcriptional regulator n=1 Tax=Chitinilyticum piscinae TaxID=2866724 RepID=A0A8J7FGZ9_9NEIS|nr:AraC family transcriptional regulator [Chitinilyticum piscinae]MBE9608995.1 AraC family transcriptional regulator [Chitinilyticum piscinae]
MQHLSRIERATRAMEENLTAPFTAVDAARAACYSYYHFHRLFAARTGVSPGEYLRRRRLTEAARLLCRSRLSITRIAFDFQYESVESFSKAFRSEFGLSPRQARRTLTPLPCFLPYRQPVAEEHFMTPKLVELPAFSILGYQIETTHEEGANFIEIPQLWERVMANDSQLMQAIPGVADRMVSFGVCTATKNGPQFLYTIGFQVAADTPIPRSMAKVDIQASRYAVFDVPEGVMPQTIHDTWKELWQFFDHSELEVSGSGDFERYEEDGDGRCCCSIWMPIRG